MHVYRTVQYGPMGSNTVPWGPIRSHGFPYGPIRPHGVPCGIFWKFTFWKPPETFQFLEIHIPAGSGRIRLIPAGFNSRIGKWTHDAAYDSHLPS